jgi:hypothetical protein
MKKYVATFALVVLGHPFWMHGFYFYVFGTCRDKFLPDLIGGVFGGIMLCLVLKWAELRRLKKNKGK